MSNLRMSRDNGTVVASFWCSSCVLQQAIQLFQTNENRDLRPESAASICAKAWQHNSSSWRSTSCYLAAALDGSRQNLAAAAERFKRVGNVSTIGSTNTQTKEHYIYIM